LGTAKTVRSKNRKVWTQLADNHMRGLEGKTGSLYLVFFPEHKQRIQHISAGFGKIQIQTG